MRHLGLIEVNKHKLQENGHSFTTSICSNVDSKKDMVKLTKERKEERIVFNVSGRIYETFASTLTKYPNTLLGDPEKRETLRDNKSGQLFIDRNHVCFEAILFFYQSSGNLIRPGTILMSIFEEECGFYEMPEDALERMKNRELFLYRPKKDLPSSHGPKSCLYKLWIFFEQPRQSGIPWIAQAYFYIFYTLVFCSIGLFCTETEMVLHLKNPKTMEYYQMIHSYIEVALNIFFITELSLRFVACPFQKDFFRKPTNTMELISVFIFILFYGFPYSVQRRNMMLFSRMLCIFRLTRLGRISKVVKTSFAVFLESVEDVIAVLFTMSIIVIFGGTVMYYMESQEPETKFKSIPDSMWWAIQTSLCLGYGDIIPQTFFGRYLGMLVLYGGVVVVMVLILSLGGRVFDMYIKEFDETCAGFLPDINDEKNEDLEIHYRDDPETELKRNNSKRASRR
ncbi:potassium voltage-gated channel subfamily A member 1-like [Clytia hemisphaerica]|uniref:potassium voltage-gated channel subfamily A member 1-like n=1 Tax=Clytia hemisphaerica TaxID=252671 RepID=UPI0034D6E9AE